ncbi:MAG TPA: hypothetical protein V6C97_16310 [Oculatellaceae cyanobacterium]
MKQAFNVVLASLLYIFMLSGCTALGEEITEFDKSVAKTTKTISCIYSNVDKFRRGMEIQAAKYKSFESLASIDAEGSPTSITTRYSSDYIAVRVQAVQALAKYADELAKLQGSDAPKEVADDVKDIGDKVKDISANIGSLAGNTKLDASKYVGPISNLAAVCMQTYLEYKRKKMIRDSLLKAQDPIHKICDALSEDIENVYQNDYINSVNNCRVKAIQYWNSHGKDLSLEEKTIVLNDLQKFSDDYFDLKAADPCHSINSIKTGLDDLVNQIQNHKTKAEQATLARINAQKFSITAERSLQITSRL